MKKSSFLVTKAAPCVFFLPKEMTARTTRALKNTEKFIKGNISYPQSKRSLSKISFNVCGNGGQSLAANYLKRGSTVVARMALRYVQNLRNTYVLRTFNRTIPSVRFFAYRAFNQTG